MDDRLSKLEAKVEELSDALERVEGRLGRLERDPSASPSDVDASGGETADHGPPAAASASLRTGDPARVDHLMGWAAAAGRTFLALGGAYLLRALTEGGTLPEVAGVSLALVYASAWLVAADRVAAKGGVLRATAHGLAFALIAFPMLAEITVRFHYLVPAEGAGAVAAATALGLFVAWKRRLRVLSWLIAVGAALVSTGMLIETRAMAPYVLLLIAIGALLDWCAAHRAWLGLRITGALLADAAGIFLVGATLALDRADVEVTLVLCLLFLAFTGSYVVRSLLQKRSFTGFERGQASAVLVVGYCGALVTAPVVLVLWLGVAGVVVGVGGYVAAYFKFVRPGKDRVDSWFHTSYALVAILAGSGLLLDEPAYAWTGISVVLAVVGSRDEYASLPLHGALCALLAAIVSGVPAHVWRAFGAVPSAEWSAPSVLAVAAVVAAGVCYLAPLRDDATRKLMPARAARVLSLSVLVAGLGVMLVFATALVVVGADAGSIATLRTGVLALSTVALAGVSRIDRFREARVLVYPILAVAGLKLFVQDLFYGHAATLFVAFAVYGIALIVAPRLARPSAPDP